jgi:cell division protein FtsI/penicillin-binding protein 2
MLITSSFSDDEKVNLAGGTLTYRSVRDDKRQMMDANQAKSINCIGRRGFLRSLFGLTTAAESTTVEAAVEAKVKPTGRWFWADLRTGQIGFPSGLNLGSAAPGSLMKLITTAALLEGALVNPNETIECRGSAVVRKHPVACQFAHGAISLPHAIGKSCNIYFAEMSLRLTSKAFLDYAHRFGLDQPVAGRPSGPFPVKAEGDSLNYVLGLADDFQPNALQILRMSALIGARGHLPHLHSAEEPASDAPPFVLKLSEGTWALFVQGMGLAVHEGTAKKLDPENKLHIAAKTGTTRHGARFQSWVTGFFPIETPHYAFCVLSPNGTSMEAAVPVAREVLLATAWP